VAHRPGIDILNYLDAHSTALTGGTNLFQGIVRPVSASVPVECVFVLPDGGPPPDRVLGTAIQIGHPHVAVIVRSSGFTSGENLAWEVMETLQSASPSTGNSYLDVKIPHSHPDPLGQDKNNHYHWRMDVEAVYQTT